MRMSLPGRFNPGRFIHENTKSREIRKIAEMNGKRKEMQFQSLMSLGAAAINLLSTVSSFLLILKVRLQTSALVATYLTKRESLWKKKVRKSQERKASRKRRSVWYVKARWSFLTKKVDLALESVPTVIYACFVLHNYCELNKCVIDPELVKIHIEKHRKEKENENYLPNPVMSGNLDEGEVVRDVLRCYIENNLNRE